MQPFEQLEHDLARWAGVENVVAAASGTAALHLALEAPRLPPGSEVIVPDFAMIACARAVSLAGMTPVFVDCNNRLLFDPESFGVATASRYDAVIAVHTYGRREDMDWLHSVISSRHRVIEDLAEAHGVAPHPESDAAVWSFYKNKHVHGEEGGAVAFRDPEHAARARSLRCLGFTPDHDFTHIPRGHNYRMSNAHASLILDSLARYEENRHARRVIEGWYDAHCPPGWRMPPREAVWVYDVRIPGLTAATQDRIVRALKAEGIEARHAFKPINTQDEFRNCRAIGGGRADVASREVFYLPVCPGQTTQGDARRAFDVITGLVSPEKC